VGAWLWYGIWIFRHEIVEMEAAEILHCTKLTADYFFCTLHVTNGGRWVVLQYEDIRSGLRRCIETARINRDDDQNETISTGNVEPIDAYCRA